MYDTSLLKSGLSYKRIDETLKQNLPIWQQQQQTYWASRHVKTNKQKQIYIQIYSDFHFDVPA